MKGNGLRYKCILRTDAGWDTVGGTAPPGASRYAAEFGPPIHSLFRLANRNALVLSGAVQVGYTLAFDTQPDGWQTVRLKFKDFVPVFRARTMRNMPPLNAGNICSIQLMLRQAGWL